MKLGRKISREGSKTVAEGLILSRLIYLIPIWGSTTENHSRKAQVLLNRAARWVTNLTKITKIEVHMREVVFYFGRFCTWGHLSI